MLTSMTGFATTSGSLTLSTLGTVRLVIELKTLNSRFFEVVAKLPATLGPLELAMTRVLQEMLVRGRVYLTVRSESNGASLERVVPSVATAQSYAQAARTIAQACDMSAELTLATLLGLPGVLVQDACSFSPQDEAAILALVRKGLEQLHAVRVAEGAALEKDFVRIFGACKEHVDQIEKTFQQLEQQHKDSLAALVPAEGQQELDDEAKVRRTELLTMLSKIDIHEEITRFNGHLAAVQKLLQASQVEKGKRIDFLLQELLREVNTMMAKCNNYGISALGIDIKVELEKAREQVQNIV